MGLCSITSLFVFGHFRLQTKSELAFLRRWQEKFLISIRTIKVPLGHRMMAMKGSPQIEYSVVKERSCSPEREREIWIESCKWYYIICLIHCTLAPYSLFQNQDRAGFLFLPSTNARSTFTIAYSIQLGSHCMFGSL